MGKSSLLNAVQPGLGLAVREISESFQKGRHTTTVRQLFSHNFTGSGMALFGLCAAETVNRDLQRVGRL